ncbi:haemagglutination activity domain protein [Coleofasciculus chthonoplastes PCC 7420]|uniref:Haemagglutination activity domain protein n=1 Tax=Coleofasciculus chthonoplastes PCC 7420 TaxID=118168 RepID=B4VMT9_9CYAN|nr:haemagglutination activity domain protein [Coleofasciculus chthonoplastes PCC 7420]
MLISGDAYAQSITPATDGTGTVVTIDGQTYNITGGMLSGDGQNLFHSFESFGLTQQEIANFLSNPEIRNVLGRVVGRSPSQIDGLLQVSGGAANLYLMNPAGIVFGPNAQLNVPGSFAATTASSIDFATGQFSAFGEVNYQALAGTPQSFSLVTGTSGSIVNTGDLEVQAGNNLALVGSTVVNTGTLTAPGGTITVVAVPDSQQVRISQDGMVLGLAMNADELAQVPADQPIAASLPELVTGGNADIASTIQVDEQGRVWLTDSQTMIPDEPGTAIVSGEINAANDTAPGGTVQILGEQVALLDATVNVSGTSGGEVFVGGDLQGGGDLPTAQYTVVDDGSVIRADALSDGDGGQVILWADGTTQFAGDISARGGINSGDGGFVEVSGLESLNFTGNVNTNAPNGAPGTLLFDPADITITAGGTVGGFDGDVLFEDAGPTEISEAQIESLAGNTNVTIQATNSITIEQMSDGFLAFQAGSGSITFEANGTFVSDSSIITNGRDIYITSGSIALDSLALYDISTSGGSISLTTTSGGLSFGNITAGLVNNPGDVEISVSPGNSLSFENIDAESLVGSSIPPDPLDGTITVNGVVQPQGNLSFYEIVGGVPTDGSETPGGGTPGGGDTPGGGVIPGGGDTPGGGETPGGGSTVNVNGAIVNIGSTGSRNNGYAGSNIDTSFSIDIPGVGRFSANNLHMWNAYARSEITWNNAFQEFSAWDAIRSAREIESSGFHTQTLGEILLDSGY